MGVTVWLRVRAVAQRKLTFGNHGFCRKTQSTSRLRSGRKSREAGLRRRLPPLVHCHMFLRCHDSRFRCVYPSSGRVGIGSDVMKPIAAPMVGGMITSTIHVLILVPIFFMMIKGRTISKTTNKEK